MANSSGVKLPEMIARLVAGTRGRRFACAAAPGMSGSKIVGISLGCGLHGGVCFLQDASFGEDFSSPSVLLDLAQGSPPVLKIHNPTTQSYISLTFDAHANANTAAAADADAEVEPAADADVDADADAEAIADDDADADADADADPDPDPDADADADASATATTMHCCCCCCCC